MEICEDGVFFFKLEFLKLFFGWVIGVLCDFEDSVVICYKGWFSFIVWKNEKKMKKKLISYWWNIWGFICDDYFFFYMRKMKIDKFR